MKTQLDTELALIKHADILELTQAVLQAAPDCFWTMPASTSGKYHPAHSLGQGGLIRHTRAVVLFAVHLLEMQGTPASHREFSIAIAAAILHDCCKKLDHEQHTSFLHPLCAQELILSTAEQLWPGCMEIPRATVEDALTTPAPGGPTIRTIAACVASHMGRWNVNDRTGQTLPTPLTPMERLIHTADYLASRKNITLADIT
jgi:hypothetical protein